MKRLSWIALVGCMCAAVGAAQDDAAKKDLDALQGEWHALSIEIDGKPQPDDEVKSVKLTFKGNKVTAVGKNMTKNEATVTLDPTKNPKTMDIVPLSGGDAGKTQLGIYLIAGDKLVICGGKGEAGVRPTELMGAKDVIYIVLAHVKSDKK